MEDDLEEYIRKQVGHMRKHFEDLEGKLDNHINEDKQVQSDIVKRITTLEKAKIYFDGQKSGAVIVIGCTITAVVGAAIWIVSKIIPAGS